MNKLFTKINRDSKLFSKVGENGLFKKVGQNNNVRIEKVGGILVNANAINPAQASEHKSNNLEKYVKEKREHRKRFS